MVETESEVEKVLREIRERVRSENGALTLSSAVSAASDDEIAGGDDSLSLETISSDELREARAALLRVEMNLATSERAWSRLPPILSYRHGFWARLELWLKRQIKRATHWYVWEQINFNSAAHQSLRDLLNAQRQMLAVLQEQMIELQMLTPQLFTLRTEMQTLRVAAEQRAAGLESRFVEIENALNGESADIAELRQTVTANIERLRAQERETLAAMKSLEAARGEWQTRLQAQIEVLQNELRERAAHILEEQRVTLKQLALQTSETAVFNDRTWRSFERRIAALESQAKDEK
jgi:hypothetical protein